MQDPHISLHKARHLLLAPGRLVGRVWHRQTRLDETNKTRREAFAPVTAVANASPERVPLLMFAPFVAQEHANLRMHDYSDGQGGGSDGAGERISDGLSACRDSTPALATAAAPKNVAAT